MWTLLGQQVQIPTHGQDERGYGIGAVNYHTGETVMITRDHKRNGDIAVMVRALVERHATGRIYLTWDNAYTHFGGEVETVLKETKGRLILLYLPTYSPWLNPIEMLWRSMRFGVTHCELFTALSQLKAAFLDFFFTTPNETVKQMIGSKAV